MSEVTSPTLTMAGLFAERDEIRRRDKEAEEQLKRKQKEELADLKSVLNSLK